MVYQKEMVVPTINSVKVQGQQNDKKNRQTRAKVHPIHFQTYCQSYGCEIHYSPSGLEFVWMEVMKVIFSLFSFSGKSINSLHPLRLLSFHLFWRNWQIKIHVIVAGKGRLSFVASSTSNSRASKNHRDEQVSSIINFHFFSQKVEDLGATFHEETRVLLD